MSKTEPATGSSSGRARVRDQTGGKREGCGGRKNGHTGEERVEQTRPKVRRCQSDFSGLEEASIDEMLKHREVRRARGRRPALREPVPTHQPAPTRHRAPNWNDHVRIAGAAKSPVSHTPADVTLAGWLALPSPSPSFRSRQPGADHAARGTS
eukprot:2082706-Prymnesium_polylepis.1